jgi:hypothetical protein
VGRNLRVDSNLRSRIPPPRKSKSKSHCDWQSVSKPWCRGLSGAHDKIFIIIWQLRVCFCWAPSLTRGRVCLLHMLLLLASVVILGSESLGTRDHILLSQIWDFPFPSSPTTRRITVEVFDPASTRVFHPAKSKLKFYPAKSSQSQGYIATDGQTVSLGVEPHLRFMTRYLLLFDTYGLVFVGRPLWREDGSVNCKCCWPLPAQFFSGPSPLGLATIYYCLKFETSLFVASYDWQGHGGGIRPRLHTRIHPASGCPRYIA